VIVRDTSLAAYREIESKGLLSRSRWAVYRWLYTNGPATAREVERGLDNISAHKRLPELRDLKVVAETGERPCQVTGMTSILWDVTSNLPTGTVSRTKKTRSELVKEIAYLKDLLHRAYKRIKELES